MNKNLKLFGLAALAVVIAFSMAVCDSGTTNTGNTTSQGGSDNLSNQDEYKTYTAYDEAGNAFILVVSGNETYVLSILKQNGTTLGSSTGTVTGSNSTSYILKSKGGNTFTVVVNVNIIVSINSPIPLDSGGTKSPEGELSSKKPGGNSNSPGNSSNPDGSDPGDSGNVTSWTVYDTNTWIEAVNGIRSGGNNKRHTITVTGDFTAQITTSVLENTFGSVTGITVTIEGSRTISQPEKIGSLLIIGREQTVIVKDLKLQGYGRNTDNYAVLVMGGGILRMQGSASLTGNNGRSGVYVGGTFIMEDNAKVFNNIADSKGGGVSVDRGGSFTMQDNAAVSGNSVVVVSTSAIHAGIAYGGGVFVIDGSFTMNGGEISNNTLIAGTTYGGGVWATPSFIMNGGVISGNTARQGGGVHANLIKTGGTIYGSDATEGLKNIATDNISHAVHGVYRTRSATAGPNMNTDNLMFWDE